MSFFFLFTFCPGRTAQAYAAAQEAAQTSKETFSILHEAKGMVVSMVPCIIIHMTSFDADSRSSFEEFLLPPKL